MAQKDSRNDGKHGGKSRLKTVFKRVALPLILGTGLFFGSALMGDNQTPAEGPQKISYSELINAVEKDRISKISINESKGTVSGSFDDTGKGFEAAVPMNSDIANILRAADGDKDMEIAIDKTPQSNIGGILFSWLPTFLLIGVMYWYMRRMMGMQTQLGNMKNKEATKNPKKVTFDDVAGVDEAKKDLQQIVDFLKDPKDATRLGAKMPKGALLVGPPGTGKTLLAKAVAGEADVSYIQIAGSDFVEMFVGRGAARVRSLFEDARKKAPCIIFIDEIDAVAKHRGRGLGGHDEQEQTLNQILVAMDGFESREGIFILAATNRPDVLDPALTRPGRFDLQVTVPLPDIGGREKILAVHTRKTPLHGDINLKEIARATPGFSGADIENLVNIATILATNDKKIRKNAVHMEDFLKAIDRILMGAPRESLIMTEDDKKLTAYHEAGHALVGLHVKHSDPLHKITIIPRGQAMGVTVNVPERDRWNYSRNEIIARLAMMYGGRAAEEIVFGKDNATTGASNDIERATEMARRMVMEWGMSDALGPIRYSAGSRDGMTAPPKDMSDRTAQLVDEEVKRILTEAHKTATDILTQNRAQLELLSQALIDRETLTGAETKKLLGMDNNNSGGTSAPGNDNKEPPKRKRGGGPPKLEP